MNTIAQILYADLCKPQRHIAFIEAYNFLDKHYGDIRNPLFTDKNYDFSIKVIVFIDHSFISYKMGEDRLVPINHGVIGKHHFKSVGMVDAIVTNVCCMN